ncbi:hypothetical protein [Novosphingobium sp. Chol11]|nr:hypothetical protein [Novosphingobium sp. Chol11]
MSLALCPAADSRRAVGKPVSGLMREGPINWTIGGRSRGLGIG